MHPRLLRAACTTATALATCALVAPAHAAPGGGHGQGGHGGKADHGTQGHGPKQDKLAKEIAKVDARLARVRLDRLDTDDAAVVAGNVTADRGALAEATSRDEVRSYRPELYSWVVNALRKTTRLETGAGADADATAAVDAAHTALLALHATSGRADVRGAKTLLGDATQAVDDLGDDAADETADETADDTGDGTDTEDGGDA
jgi:hypothetical protein